MRAHYERIDNLPRDRGIVRDRLRGATFRELANRHGVSVGRAHAIVHEARPVTGAGGRLLLLRTGARHRFTGRPIRTRRPCSVGRRTTSRGVGITHPVGSLLGSYQGLSHRLGRGVGAPAAEYSLTDRVSAPRDPPESAAEIRAAQFWHDWHDERERERGRCGGCGLDHGLPDLRRCPMCGRIRQPRYDPAWILDRQAEARRGLCGALFAWWGWPEIWRELGAKT